MLLPTCEAPALASFFPVQRKALTALLAEDPLARWAGAAAVLPVAAHTHTAHRCCNMGIHRAIPGANQVRVGPPTDGRPWPIDASALRVRSPICLVCAATPHSAASTSGCQAGGQNGWLVSAMPEITCCCRVDVLGERH